VREREREREKEGGEREEDLLIIRVFSAEDTEVTKTT